MSDAKPDRIAPEPPAAVGATPIADVRARAAARQGFGPIERIATGLSLAWLVLVAAFWLFVPGPGAGLDAAALVMAVTGILLPLVMIWIAAITARTAAEMRAEAQALKASVETMRTAWLAQAQLRPGSTIEKKLDEVAQVARQAETAIATFTSRRDAGATQPSADRKAALVAPAPAAPGEDQPALALGTPAEALAQPVSVADFIRALNFPDNADDREGFRALRRALEDRTMAKLIRAAQDVLNLLSQDGIYMDDLRPDRARPELWRRFAQGERGREIAALGGVRDRSSLALTAGRMRSDTIFRDAAHHFLRQFDRTFTEFEANASDQEVAELAETRTARAFMLLGRVTGTFD
ncbi:hypothetical protein [Sinirhodobacter huangdaonensis]|uniref:Uncharacterized protein n=1 Tax=Paenirhodobacter huangdaonensis TaxID=2501515 RepID=A0A3S3LE85_9RHOB|nr:hypothetical protein [Sinirhodobacter huangdaonensis]RWR53394.1 hypothetical protein EOW66_06715 [Sinirhodobacter huangdaonensis]